MTVNAALANARDGAPTEIPGLTLSTINVLFVGVDEITFPAASVPEESVTVAVPLPGHTVPVTYVHVLAFCSHHHNWLLTTTPEGPVIVILGVVDRFSEVVIVTVCESPVFTAGRVKLAEAVGGVLSIV